MITTIGKTLKNLYLQSPLLYRGYAMSSVLYMQDEYTELKVEQDIVKLNNRLTDEINALMNLAQIKFNTNLFNLTGNQFAQLLFSDEFRIFRNVYSSVLGRYVSATEIFALLRYYLDNRTIQFNSIFQTIILSRVYNDDVENAFNKLYQKYQRLDVTSVVDTSIYVETNTYLYNESLLQFRNYLQDVSYLTQLTDSRNATTEFDEESLYIFSNYDEYGKRWVKTERTYSENNTAEFFKQYYDEKDYRKEIFGNRNYHYAGYISKRLEKSFLLVVDSWLQKIKYMVYDTNKKTFVEDTEKSDIFTSNYFGTVIYDSDFVYLSHTFSDFGVIVAVEEKGYDVESYSILKIKLDEDNKNEITHSTLHNTEYQFEKVNNYRKNVKVILYDVNTFEEVTMIYINEIVSDKYPYILPYVLYSTNYLMIYNILNSQYVLINISTYEKQVYSFSNYKVNSFATVYMIPYDEQRVLFIELDRDVVKETVSEITSKTGTLILEEWQKPNSFQDVIQTIIPDPVFYSNSLKKHNKIQNVYTFVTNPVSYRTRNENLYPKYNDSIIVFNSIYNVKGITNNQRDYKVNNNKSEISITNWFVTDENVTDKNNVNATKITFNPSQDIQSFIDSPYINFVDMTEYWVPDIHVYDIPLINNITVYTNYPVHEINRKMYDGRTSHPGLITKATLFNFVSGNVSQYKHIEYNEIISTLLDKNESIDVIPSYSIMENISSKTYSMYLKSTSNLAYFFMTNVVYDIFNNFKLAYTVPSPERKLIDKLYSLYKNVIHEEYQPNILPYYYSPVYESIIKIYNIKSEKNLKYSMILNDLSSVINSTTFVDYFETNKKSSISQYKLFVPANSQFPQTNNYDKIKIDKLQDNTVVIDSYEDILIQDGFAKIPVSSVFIRDRVEFEEVS